jgi:hypothetical protein
VLISAVEEADQMQQSVLQYGLHRGFRHYFLAWWNKVSKPIADAAIDAVSGCQGCTAGLDPLLHPIFLG